jgi:hypothetical protein
MEVIVKYSRRASDIHSRGLTLIEVLVSLLILMIVLGAIFSILHLQTRKATNVQVTTIMQTDANIALTLLRWDLFMAGYGIAMDQPSIQSINYSDRPDTIILRGAALGFESGNTNWAPVLDNAKGVDKIILFAFSDPSSNLSVGDSIIIVDQQKKMLDSGLVIINIDTIQHIGGVDTLPALEATLDRNVDIGMGSLAFKANPRTYQGVTYSVINRQLLRDNEVFLDNVEDVQFAYGVDLNDNGVFEDPGEWFMNLNAIPGYNPQLLYSHKTAIRSTFVVLSEQGLADYEYPENTIQVEDHTYAVTNLTRKYKREIVVAISWPRNLQE